MKGLVCWCEREREGLKLSVLGGLGFDEEVDLLRGKNNGL